MKFFTKSKHIIVTAFTLFAIFSFSYPIIANAQEDVVYGGLTRPNEDLSIRSWGKNFIIGNAIDIALAFPCGGENDKEKIFGENGDCVPPLSDVTANLQGDKPRMTGGMAAMSAMAMEYSVSEPMIPTDMALFMDDTFNDTIFTTKESYAQSELNDLSKPTEFFQASTFTLWKFSRNISLGLLGVLLAIAGLSILFRSKLSPQVTVTVANVLPYLPLSIIGIVLSYPIIAVAYNLMGPLLSIAQSIGMTVYNELAPDAGTVQAGGGLYLMLGGLFGLLLFPGTWFIAATGAILAFPLIVVMLVAVYLLLVGIFKYIFEYAKTIVMFVFYVVVFPIVSAIAILPGKQNLITLLFKKVLANLVALPVMTLLVLVGLGFMASMGNPNNAQPGEIQYIASGGGAIFGAIIKFAIGYSIISQSFKARSIMEGVLGAGGSLMSSFSGGGSSGGPGGKK